MLNGQNAQVAETCDTESGEESVDDPVWDCELEKYRDETIVKIITVLEQYCEKANSLNLKITARILMHAREHIIQWISKGGFNEAKDTSDTTLLNP